MALKPTKPTVPSPALRSLGKDTFNARVESNVNYFQTHADYSDAVVTYVDERADDVAINAVLPVAQVWTTSTAYVVNDVVSESGLYYVCLIAHTAGTFATDLAAGRWELIGAERFDVNANTLILTGGSGNAYTLTAQETITSYATGQLFRIQINHENTGAATINIDGVGVKDIQRPVEGTPTALTAGTLGLGEIHDIGYDGTRFLLHTQPVNEITDLIGWKLIESQDASASATLDFTGFDATKYDAYEFRIANIIPSTDGSVFRMRVSTDGGSSYDSTSNYKFNVMSDVMNETEAQAYLGSVSSSFLALDPSIGVGNAAGEDGVSLTIDMNGPGLAKKTHVGWGGSLENASGAIYRIEGAGAHLSSAAVDAVRFYFSAGNIGSGTITLYGLRNS